MCHNAPPLLLARHMMLAGPISLPSAWRTSLDANRFDRLSKSVATLSTRRNLFAILASLPLVSSLTLTSGDAAARRRRKRSRGSLRAEACIPTGKPCPSKKPRGHNKRGKAHTLSCNRCCQGHVATVNGVSTCACQPDTMPCTTTTECCAGVCNNGSCVASTSPPSPPPLPPSPPPPPPPPCPGGQTLCDDDVCRECCPRLHRPRVRLRWLQRDMWCWLWWRSRRMRHYVLRWHLLSPRPRRHQPGLFHG